MESNSMRATCTHDSERRCEKPYSVVIENRLELSLTPVRSMVPTAPGPSLRSRSHGWLALKHPSASAQGPEPVALE